MEFMTWGVRVSDLPCSGLTLLDVDALQGRPFWPGDLFGAPYQFLKINIVIFKTKVFYIQYKLIIIRKILLHLILEIKNITFKATGEMR